MTRMMSRWVMLVAAQPVWAHEGHGLSGFHWHGLEGLGGWVLVLLLALAVWRLRK